MNMYRYNVCRYLNKKYLVYFSSKDAQSGTYGFYVTVYVFFHVILYYSVYHMN